VQGQADLFEVVLAFGPGSGVADLLHGRQEQSDQDGDDGDDHQQLDQRECRPAGTKLDDHKLSFRRRAGNNSVRPRGRGTL
jgi:hypothetical protein